jgi:outer membrane murein-binding lipoprotein Lpp
MYEVSALDHLNAKVDALFQKFDKLTVSVVTPPPTSPSCEVCEIFVYTGVECQLGSAVESPEQVNYAQYNKRMRNNQKIYNKIPQNPFGQLTAPPDYANNQSGPQKSNLEFLLENFVMGQSKQNQEFKNQTGFLNVSLIKLTSKVDSIATHNKKLETQISQVAQQVATSSQTFGVFSGQPETNPKG